jgi:transposase-like protein
MPLPKTTVRKAPRIYFDPRAGSEANAWWYECQRGHKKRGTAATRSDIDALLHEHDEFHFGGRGRGKDATLGEAVTAMLADLELLIARGKRRSGTLEQRRVETRRLLAVIGSQCNLSHCQTTRIKWYIQQRLAGKGLDGGRKSSTAGEHIIKELKCLAYLAKSAKVELDWTPLDEWIIDFIRPVHREKLWIEPQDLVLFINTLRRLRDADAAERVESYGKRLHMVRQVAEQGVTLREAAKEAGLSDRAAWEWVRRYKRDGATGIERHAGWESRVAYAYVLLKATTVMRDVELRDLRVRQIDTREKVIPYLNRSKRKERDAIAVIDDLVVEALAPLLKDKHPEAYVFEIDSRPLGETTLCKITLRAWHEAFYDAQHDAWKYPPQKYLSWIRHNVLTDIIGRTRIGCGDGAGKPHQHEGNGEALQLGSEEAPSQGTSTHRRP